MDRPRQVREAGNNSGQCQVWGKGGRSRFVVRTLLLHSHLLLAKGHRAVSGQAPSFVVVFASEDIGRVITVKGEVIEDEALGATRHRWVLALHADVEATAVIGLDVTGMIQNVAVGVDLSRVGASETIFKDLDSDATSSSHSSVFPLAGAGELIEDETSVAGVENGFTVGALVVLVAVSGVLVLEVSILSWAFDARGLGDLKSGSLGALDHEGVVALFYTGGEAGVEHETIGAELLSDCSSVAVEVLVALDGVSVETILGGTCELCAGGNSTSEDYNKGQHD